MVRARRSKRICGSNRGQLLRFQIDFSLVA
jgi:hypothetical protein